MSGAATAALLVLGAVMARALLRGSAAGVERWGWSLALAPALGFGVASLLYVGWRAVGGSARAAGLMLVAAGAVGAAAWFGSLRARAVRAAADAQPAGPPFATWIAFAALLLALLFAVRASAAYWVEVPDGAYDAVATWNLRARLLFLAPEGLARALDATNYPLLLPGAVAFQWAALGEMAPQVPRATGLAFLLGTAVVLAVGLRQGGRAVGWAAGALFLATPFAVGQGCSQEADVPTGYLLVLAAALLGARLRAAASPPPELAGAALGLLAWTKNEGLLWVGLALACLALAGPAALRRDGFRIGLGALPGLGALALFKLLWAPASGLAATAFLGAGSWQRLFEPERWRLVGGALLERLDPTAGPFPWGFAWLFLLVASVGLRGLRSGSPGPALRFFSGLAITCLAVVPVVYLLTPLPLAWHLETSLDRLLLQLYPLGLLAVAAAAAEILPGEPAAAPRRSERRG